MNRESKQSGKALFTRATLKLAAYLSRFYTYLRHPVLASSPDIFLRYYTDKQQQALSLIGAKAVSKATVARRVLIIIPFRDKWDMTRRCIDSLLTSLIDRHQVLIALVDNGSVEEQTISGIKALMELKKRSVEFRHLRYDIPFNFSSLNNKAFHDCQDYAADYVLCLNNDIEVLQSGFLEKMVRFADRSDDVGAVGCTLLYPNRRIQHLFVFVGCKIVGAHPFKGKKLDPTSLWYQSPQPVSAVTGACMLMKSAAFAAVGGYDEKLANCYQDVDLCLKLQQKNLVNWTLPDIQMIHYETQTRRPIASWEEVSYIYEKWGSMISQNPFISSRFSTWSETISLRFLEGRNYPWQKIRY